MNYMRLFVYVSAVVASAGPSFAAPPKTNQEWEACRDKAEASVDQRIVGVLGIEAEIKAKCGAPPVKEPGSLTGAVGVPPYDLVRSKAWKSKFVAIAKGEYKSFVENITVASDTELVNGWVIGQGQAPHMGGEEEAAFAINAKTGEVYAAILHDGNRVAGFGFVNLNDAPSFLKEWISDRKK